MTLKEALKKAGNRKVTITYKEYGGLPWAERLQSDEDIAKCADVKVVKYKEYETECCGWSPFSGVTSKYTIPTAWVKLDSRQATTILKPNRMKKYSRK